MSFECNASLVLGLGVRKPVLKCRKIPGRHKIPNWKLQVKNSRRGSRYLLLNDFSPHVVTFSHTGSLVSFLEGREGGRNVWITCSVVTGVKNVVV